MERGGKLYEAIQHYKRAMQILPDVERRLYESTDLRADTPEGPYNRPITPVLLTIYLLFILIYFDSAIGSSNCTSIQHHHQPIDVPTARAVDLPYGLQIRRTGHNPPRGPS
jgi:hypothetical protein